jgi:hypothetical protein
MRRSRLAVFACLSFAMLFACAVASGQEQTPTPQQPRAPERLVVQVEYFKGMPLAYESVPGGSWFGRFALTPAAAARAPADTVLAVDVKTRMDDGRVEIKVGVHVGAQHFDRLDEVATYHATAGETVVASDLERFGVGPFRMTVLRVSDTLSAAPTIVNRTQSIEAVVSKFDPSPLPRATVTLRNLSSKKVLAVDMRQVIDGKEKIFSFVSERDGKILMEPGGTAEKKFVASRGNATQTDFTPQAIESVVVASAVFDDYTYEGDVHAAARKRAFDEGERLQLPRLVALLRETRGARGDATADALKRLKEKLSAVDENAPAPSVDAIMKGYSELKPADRELVEGTFSVSMHEARRTLLDELQRFESDFKRDPAANDFGAWLKSRRERFEQWLARL